MSSTPLRSGGKITSTTFKRNSRSSRNRPAFTSCSRRAIGRGDDTNIGAPRGVFTDALELLFLAKSAAVWLADSVQSHRLHPETACATLRALDATWLIANRSGEGSACVSKQLTGQQIFRQRWTVDHHKRMIFARTVRGRSRARTFSGSAFNYAAAHRDITCCDPEMISKTDCILADCVSSSTSGIASASCSLRFASCRLAAAAS